MLGSGADIAVVSKLLGHGSIAITSDVFGHVIGTVASEAVNGAANLIAHIVHTAGSGRLHRSSFSAARGPPTRANGRRAGVAQLAAHLSCKQVVGGSSPPASSVTVVRSHSQCLVEHEFVEGPHVLLGLLEVVFGCHAAANSCVQLTHLRHPVCRATGRCIPVVVGGVMQQGRKRVPHRALSIDPLPAIGCSPRSGRPGACLSTVR